MTGLRNDNDYSWIGQPVSVDQFKRRVRVRMAAVTEEARGGRVVVVSDAYSSSEEPNLLM